MCMKRGIVIWFLFLILMVSSGCTMLQPQKSLSALQVQACATAERAGSCTTRLEEVGIVTKEACCQSLGACCP